jgi:putative PEP-CTERM system TPR-repeat lipoprotein
VTYLEAGIALRSGAYAQARELSARLLSQTRDNPQVLLLAGEAELKTNALVQAEAHLNKLLALEPQALHARRLLAIIHIRTGEPALALNTLRPAMDAKTKDTETLMLAAEAHLLLGDSRMAEPIYQQVARQEPANVKARTALALTQLARGDVLGAITELESIAAKDEGSLADLVLVDVRLRQRDLQGALRAIDALEKKQPERALPALLRGTVYAQMRRHAAARESYEAASKRDPLFFPALKALADMDLSELRPDLARQRYEALLKVEPKQAQAYVELAAMTLRQGGPAAEVAQLLSKAIESRPTEPSYRVMLVNHWLSRGDPRQALSVAQAATAAIPDASSVLDALGRAQVANRETTQALATFGQLAAKDPKSAFPQLRLADVHAKTGNMRAAEAALRKALEIAPDLVAANRGLIVMAMRARDSARALQLARAFQARRPRDVEGYLMEADILAAAKQWDAAAKALRTAMSKDDGAVAAVRLHILLGEHPGAGDAAELAREWLRGHPKDTALRTRLGQVAMDSGDHAAAEQVYRQILQLDPNNAVAANNLAWLMAREKKSGAVAMAEEALRLAPQQPRVMDTLAFALAQEGDIQRAIAVSRSAVRADPDMAPLRLTLAKLYLQAQDKKAARAELEALSKLGERFKSQPEVQALLGAL